jgi:hypothetical protein
MSSVISRIAALMSCACLLLVLASCASLLQTGKIRNDVGIVIDKASLQGNYLAEKSAREVGLLIEDINSDIQANERTIFDFTNETLDRIQSQIDNYLQALGQAQDELLQLEDMAYLDISSIVNSIPFLKDRLFIRSIKGYTQAYRAEGYYTIALVGNAFDTNAAIEVSIDGKALPATSIQQKRQYETAFTIPSKQLNSYFNDLEIGRVNVEIRASMEKKPNFFNYRFQLLLLPRFPLSYTLKIANEKQTGWSEPALALNSIIVPASGDSGTWTAAYPISVSVPAEYKKAAKVLKEKTGCSATYAPSDWIRYSKPIYSEINDR